MTGKELWYVAKACALAHIAGDAFNDERIRMDTRLDTSHGMQLMALVARHSALPHLMSKRDMRKEAEGHLPNQIVQDAAIVVVEGVSC